MVAFFFFFAARKRVIGFLKSFATWIWIKQTHSSAHNYPQLNPQRTCFSRVLCEFRPPLTLGTSA